MRLVTTAIAAAVLSLGLPAAAQTTESVVHFQGSDGNWFNPANWSSGRVPGAGDDVQLDGDDYVVIDPAANAGAGKLQFQDLHLRDAATLETLAGTIIENRDTTIDGDAELIQRSSGGIGDTLIFPNTQPCFSCTGMKLNPSPKSKRVVVLQSSTVLDLGLGGTTPASLSRDAAGSLALAAGRGHYATLVTNTLLIDGELKISTYYDFSPQPGDSFQIMTVNRSRSGEFIGAPEGGYVGCTEDNVGLRISYAGGDGNDVVITAEQAGPALCLLLPAVQQVREAASRAVSLTRETVLPIAGVVEAVGTSFAVLLSGGGN